MNSAKLADADWLYRFHDGDRSVLDACYRDHIRMVVSRISRVLQGADTETVAHEVFLRLLSSEALRRSFRASPREGAFAAWLRTLARNQAIDFKRRQRRELPLDEARDSLVEHGQDGGIDSEAEARQVLERFRNEVLPAKWSAVFDVCFVERLDQRTAAQRLSTSRTTLCYQRSQVRDLLSKFLRSLRA